MGRYLPYRLHPFSVAESEAPPSPDQAFERRRVAHSLDDLLRLGGFPEPLFAGSEARARRWSRLRVERLVTEDVRDLRAISDLSGVRVLADLLPDRVGSLLSVNSLREDIGTAHGTVVAWLGVFEALYHCFLVTPWSKRIARAVRAAPKLYMYDVLQLPREAEAARLENLTALHLLKAVHYWTDAAHGDFELRFIRDKEQREVDFLIVRDRKPWALIECKTGDTAPSPSLVHFARILGVSHAWQLVRRPRFDRAFPALGVRVIDYEAFFAGLV